MFQELTCSAKDAKGFTSIRCFAWQAECLMRGLPICHNSAPLEKYPYGVGYYKESLQCETV